jgi:hypothetical protein
LSGAVAVPVAENLAGKTTGWVTGLMLTAQDPQAVIANKKVKSVVGFASTIIKA